MKAERTTFGAFLLAICLCACDQALDPLDPGDQHSPTDVVAISNALPAVQRTAALQDVLTRVLPKLGESADPLGQALRQLAAALASAGEADQQEAAAAAQAALETYAAEQRGQNAEELDVIRLAIAAVLADR